MRIVIGLDGSESSLTAHRLVATTPWPCGSLIRLVTVLDAATDQRLGDAEAMLDELAEPLRRRGYAVQRRVERGPAADQLLAAAREMPADLLIVGSRRRGPTASTLFGSVSGVVADHAPCPVLVARTSRIARILFATDGSESARAVPAILCHWRIYQHAIVDVLSVAHGPSRPGEAFVTPWAAIGRDRDTIRTGDAERHMAIAEDAAADLVDAGWRAAGLVRLGDPADEILRVAHDGASDLIVTGSRGLGDLQRLLVGSVAHDVLLHSRCAVLIMRGHVTADARQMVSVPMARPMPAGSGRSARAREGQREVPAPPRPRQVRVPA